MKTNKLYFLSFLFLFALSVCAYSQTVRYVAYFPVPYISHQVVNVDTAHFAGKDGASVEVNGKLTATSLSADKDLLLASSSASAGTVGMLNVGSNSDTKGKFIVNKTSGQLTLTNIPTAGSTGAVNANEVKADETLKVKNVKWVKDSSTNYNGLVKGYNSIVNGANVAYNSFPVETKNLCWKPLRLKGSYEYQYYLIAISGTDCDTYTGQ